MIFSEFIPPRRWGVAVLFAALLPALPLCADDDLPPPYELKPDLLITPARGAQVRDDVLDSVTVITRDDIERSVAQDLPELLRLVPGVDVVRSGPAGAQTSVFLRGTNSNHVLVLIDGIRAGSTNTGAYAWEQLPLNQIERIEIVRGPKGSVYGSDAIGGVVQVFTRSSPEPYARATWGSWGSREIEGGWGFESDATRVSVNGAARHADGFSAQNAGGYAFDPDDDGLDAVNLGIRGAHALTGGDLHFSLLATATESEFDQGVSDAHQTLASLRYAGAFGAAWQHDLVVGYFRDRLRSDFGAFTTAFLSERVDAAWQHEVSASPGRVYRFGVDYILETGDDDGSFDRTRDNVGVYAGFEQTLSRWLLQGSARLDENSAFGSELTGQVGLGFDLSPAWRLAGTWGRGFRGPNLNEQFSPGFGGLFAGNPDLRPETSRSVEASVRWRGDRASLRIAAYRTRVDDLIVFAGPAFEAVNIAQAVLDGVEIEYRVRRGGWALVTNATLQKADNGSTGQPLPRRPEHKGSLTLERRVGPSMHVGLDCFVSGGRVDFGGVPLSGYRLLGVRAVWQTAPAWRLEFRADNLLDESWEPAAGFNAGGRAVFASVHWMP